MRAALLLLLALVATAAAADVEDAPCEYIVQAGDSAYSIGRRFALTLDDVAATNPAIADITLIRGGDVLQLPCAGNVTEGASLLDLVSRRSELSTLFAAVLAAGAEVVKELNDTAFKGTLFAPTDAAFEEALAGLGINATDLLQDKLLLGDLLAYHIVPELTDNLDELTNNQNLTTLLAGEYLLVNKPKDVVRIKTTHGDKVRVEAKGADLEAGAAKLHIIKGVLLPESLVGEDAAKPKDECVHKVAEGDTLFDVAKKYGTTVDILKKLNPSVVKGDFVDISAELVLYESCV